MCECKEILMLLIYFISYISVWLGVYEYVWIRNIVAFTLRRASKRSRTQCLIFSLYKSYVLYISSYSFPNAVKIRKRLKAYTIYFAHTLFRRLSHKTLSFRIRSKKKTIRKKQENKTFSYKTEQQLEKGTETFSKHSQFRSNTQKTIHF